LGHGRPVRIPDAIHGEFRRRDRRVRSPVPDALVLYRGGNKETIALDARMGYELEIAYFLECIAKGEKPTIVTMEDAANAVTLIDAEEKSVLTGKQYESSNAQQVAWAARP